MARSGARRLFAAVVAAVCAVVATPSPGAGGEPGAPGGVVLIGVSGLRWSDLSPQGSPHLWRMAGGGSVAALSVRTIGTRACPMDGWLTVSAGARAALPGHRCGQAPDAPVPQGDGWKAPTLERARQANLRSNFRGAVGSLGDAVHGAGRCVAGVGPLAALAAADSAGRLDLYRPSPAAAGAADWSRCAVTLVEVDRLARAYLGPGTRARHIAEIGDGARAAAVRQADADVGGILAALPPNSNVVVAGLSDEADVPHLRVLIAEGPAFRAGTLLHSPSTRRDGLAILPDLTATVLTAAGLPLPQEVVGLPPRTGPRQGSPAAARQRLDGQDVAAQVLRTTLPGFFVAFVAGQLLLYALAAVALRRAGLSRRRRRVLGAARALALAGAAVPAAAYLVNLLPWWKTGHPGLALFTAVAAIDLALVAAALAGPWRRDPMTPGTVVAGITALVCAGDLLTGGHLQMNSLMGYSPLVGGRYYGLGNIAFATLATSTLFLAAGLARLLNRAGRRAWAVAAVLVLGLAADAVSGSPAFGAKFGGTIALIPGTLVTALIVAGKRVTPLRLLASAALGVATIAAICALDYLKPPAQRTHLGRFAGQLLDGEAVPVVTRKMLAMLHTVGNIPLTLLVAAGLLFLFLALTGTSRHTPGPLHLSYERAPELRAALTGTLVTSMSGFAVEDSGIAVPAIALTLAVPLAFAATARVLTAGPAPAAPTAAAPEEEHAAATPAVGTASGAP